MEILKEANNNIKLHVEFYPYERYGGGGGKKKANVSAPDMLTALKKLVDKMGLYIDSEEIEDEGYTPEEVIEQIQMSNGDGCDYITLLQEMNSGDVLIQEDYDEEEDWDDMDESLKEDLENLEKVDATTTMNITMGTAKEESKTLWQRLEDAEKIPEDAPLFGAKDQPVPEEVEEPKVELKESLSDFFDNSTQATQVTFDFGHNGDYDRDAIVDGIARIMSDLGLEFTGYIDFDSVTDSYQESLKTTLDESLFDTKKLAESFVTEWWGQVEENPYDFADNYNLECEKIKDNLDSTLYRFSGSKEDIERAMGDGYFYSVWEGEDEGHSDDLNESLKESDEDDVEISDEAINDILDDVKGVFDECEFTPDEVVDKIFDCIADESKVEFAQGILDSMEEGEEELTEGVDTFEDSLAVIKKYFNGRKASEVIDTIFTNNPAVDSDKLEDVAIKLGQFLDDYLDECKLAENFI